MKITNRIIENYVSCKYKASLALSGETGTPHDYEILMNELANQYRPKATEALLRRCNVEDVPRIPFVVLDDLEKGHPLILDCAIQIEQFHFHFDALKKVNEESPLGPFHYTPVMFRHEERVRERDRLLSAYAAFCIAKLQRFMPKAACFVSGPACRLTSFQIGKRGKEVCALYEQLLLVQNGRADARLLLRPGLPDRYDRHAARIK